MKLTAWILPIALTTLLFAAPQKEAEIKDQRLLRVQELLESDADIRAVQAAALKNATFKNAEALYARSNQALKSANRDEFLSVNNDATNAYLKAAKEGVELAAFYAKQIADERFLGAAERYNEILLASSDALIKAGRCYGYLVKSNYFHRLGDIDALGKTANEGLKKCDPKRLNTAKGEWIISRLSIESAHAKAVTDYLAKERDAK
jgi:hypothetical protein